MVCKVASAVQTKSLPERRYNMDRVYLDTVTLRFEFPKHSLQRKHSSRWSLTTETYGGQKVVSHYLKEDHFTLRVFDCFVNGKSILSATFSVPKVLNGNNYCYADIAELGGLYTRLDCVIQKNLTAPKMINIMKGQVSRADLFYMHPIEPELREVYHNAYACMKYRAFTKIGYISTNYLTSKPFQYHKGNPASVVYRCYDKDIEAFQRNYPGSVHEDFENAQEVEYTPPGYRRFEAQFLRPKLKRMLKKNSVTLADISDPQFQVKGLDSFFLATKMYDRMLPVKELHHQIQSIFPREKTRRNATDITHDIRNGMKPKKTVAQQRYVTDALHANGIHYISTPNEYNGKQVPPLAMLSREDLYTGADIPLL
jgi:hypothetical protein